jgi:predicted enzyme related to lactoylglutathione lyase
MGERTKYSPGTFSWADLSTTDQDGAKQFYGDLFGWTADDQPVGEDMTYSMMQIDGQNVAAIATQPEQQRKAGVPANWQSFITVESADETLDRAKTLGANVHAAAFDVFDAGRMGVVQDPQGAFFLVWQPKEHIGASLVNAPGALSWNELASPDLDASADFYRQLFGWKVEPFEGMEMPYMTIQTVDGHGNGGIRAAAETEPTYWLVYFGTDDIDSGLNRAAELGGNKLMGPIDIGAGKIGVVQDPQGAVFALYAGQFEP